MITALARLGIEPVRQRGSHIQLRGTIGGVAVTVTVPANRRELHPKVLRSILRQANITQEQLEELIG